MNWLYDGVLAPIPHLRSEVSGQVEPDKYQDASRLVASTSVEAVDGDIPDLELVRLYGFATSLHIPDLSDLVITILALQNGARNWTTSKGAINATCRSSSKRILFARLRCFVIQEALWRLDFDNFRSALWSYSAGFLQRHCACAAGPAPKQKRTQISERLLGSTLRFLS